MPKTSARKPEMPLARSEIVKRVKQKDAAAELALRSALHGLGLRSRLHRRIEGVVVDVGFLAAKVAVFVDGCFWHGCPLHSTFPKSNRSDWLAKLAENKERDQRQSVKLRSASWTVIRLWKQECLLTSRKTAQRIAQAVSRRLRSKGKINAH